MSMSRRSICIVLVLNLALLFTATSLSCGNETSTDQSDKPKADVAKQVARDIIDQFEKGYPDWKARMEGLIRLVKAGPDVIPVLTDALSTGAVATREFAAQALVLFADPASRSALERALLDPMSGVRVHAIQALSML